MKTNISVLVFALYDQNRRIGILLTITISGAFVMSVILGILTLRALNFDGTCGASGTPKEAGYFR